MVAYRIQVFGKVQGVFFRASTKTKADVLGLKGWVKNLIDGSVHIEIQGEDSDVQKFLTWCESGPDFARVSRLDIVEIAVQTFSSFEIQY